MKGDTDATLGIPSLAKQNLNTPTTESPAIIMGAFDGCSGVYVFAPAFSNAEYLCTAENGFVFIETIG